MRYPDDFRHHNEFNEVRDAFFEDEKGIGPMSAGTCIEARICRPDLLMETEDMAMLPRDRS